MAKKHFNAAGRAFFSKEDAILKTPDLIAHQKESWKDYEAILKEYIINKKASDKNYAKKVVAELLKEYKVEVKDEAFKNVIEQYLNHKDGQTTELTDTTETSSTTESK